MMPFSSLPSDVFRLARTVAGCEQHRSENDSAKMCSRAAQERSGCVSERSGCGQKKPVFLAGFEPPGIFTFLNVPGAVFSASAIQPRSLAIAYTFFVLIQSPWTTGEAF